MPLVRVSGRRSRLAAVLAITAVLAGLATAVPRPALAIHTTGVTAVTAQSFNYYSNVSLFGGPYVTRGYGQDPDIAGAAASASPSASCSTDGATTNVDADGARAAYGPSVIFGGIWPEGNSLAPPSGPLTSGVNCQTGAGGSATASTDVVMMPPGSTWTTPTNPARIEPHPGGVGPSPFYAEEVHTVCSAASDGTMTGTTNIVGGVLETKYDPTTQEPIVTEAVPANPAPNYTKQGTIDHVGDSYEIVFNEQIMNPDGSLTVNGAHMTLLGPTAFGDLVIGSATCDVTVGPLAHVAAPVANDDMYSTSFETPLTVAAPAGVLANDTDADGDPLTAEMPSDPANGSVVLNLDGSFTYTPDAGFSGTDTFTYMVHDPQNQMDTATVTITVNAPSNRPPVANDDTYSTAYETPLTVAAPAGVLANDTDADGDVLTAEMPSDPPNGSVMLNTDGSFTYTPDAGFSGTDTFTYMVHDPADAMDTAVVTITVAGPPNQAPTAADDSYATGFEAPLTVAAPGVLANDGDPDGNLPLTANMPGNVVGGNVQLNPNGSFTFTPNAGFSGAGGFTYMAHDALGAMSDPATVTVQVGPPPTADLSVTSEPNNLTQLAPGQMAVIRFYVTNNGPDGATGVTSLTTMSGVRGTLALAGTSGQSCTILKGRTKGVRCDIGSLANGATFEVTLSVTAARKVGVLTLATTASSSSYDPTSPSTATHSITVAR